MATVLLGRTTAGTTPDFFGNGHPTAWKFTASASGTLATIFAQFKVTNATLTTVQLGIYSDGGTAPSALLASASTSTGITGTGSFSVDVSASAVAVSSSTAYWLSLRGVGEQVDFQGTSAGSYLEDNNNTVLQNPWHTAGNTTSTTNIVIWGEDSGGGGGTTVKKLAALGVG